MARTKKVVEPVVVHEDTIDKDLLAVADIEVSVINEALPQVEIKNIVTGEVKYIQKLELDSWCVDNGFDKDTVFMYLDHPGVINVNGLVFTTVLK